MENSKIDKYPAYKDSSVQWLGEIPEHWEVRRIKTISRIKRGASPRPIDDPRYFNDDGEFSWVRISDVTSSNHYLFSTEQKLSKLGASYSVKIHPNDLFISIAGSVGKPIISRIKCCIHDGFVYFPDLSTSTLNIEYLFRIFETGQPYLGLGKFGTQLNLNTETVGQISIPFPPLSEQIAITIFLDHSTNLIDQAIGIKEKQIELLKERRQILIHCAVTRGLNPDIKLKDSGLEWIGEIPEHWDAVSNRVLYQERNEPGNESLAILSVSIHTAVSSEELSEEDNLHGKNRIADKSSYKLVKPNDIVFNMMRAWQGAIGAVRVNGMVSPAYVVAEPIENINSDFFEYQYRTPSFIQQMDRNSKGITDFRKRLYWNEFKQLKTILPPIQEQKEIVSYIENITLKIATAVSLKEKEIEKLKEYKASLINSAVTGKIKIN